LTVSFFLSVFVFLCLVVLVAAIVAVVVVVVVVVAGAANAAAAAAVVVLIAMVMMTMMIKYFLGYRASDLDLLFVRTLDTKVTVKEVLGQINDIHYFTFTDGEEASYIKTMLHYKSHLHLCEVKVF
jgi:hypothetical protein